MLASQAIMLAISRLAEAQANCQFAWRQSSDALGMSRELLSQRENELGECLKVIDDLCTFTGVR